MTRVSDLAGAELALWVAKAEGLLDAAISDKPAPHHHHGKCLVRSDKHDRALHVFRPHEDWSQGGPLLPGGVVMYSNVGDVHDFAFRDGDKHGHAEGPTLLIAAMRALVASVYGEEVPS